MFCTFVFLKKIIVISLLSIYLIPLTGLIQLVKVPVFIEHFISHKDKEANLSFIQFLDIHYFHGDVKDADYDKDMKLPFKSNGEFTNTIEFSYIPNNFHNFSIKTIPAENKSYSIYSEKFLPSSYYSSVWQPPKFC